MMKTLIIALALLGQEPGPLPDLSHPWTLRECTDWAMENNLTVAQQRNTLESREVDKNTATWAWLPSVNASAGENLNFGRGLGGNNTYERGNSSTTSFGLNAGMTLFDGLATPNRAALARLNLEAATEDLNKAQDDVRVNVAKAYVQILYNYEILDVAREQFDIDSLQVVRLEGLFDNGKASAADVSQQKASMAQSRLSIVQAQNNLRASLLDLAQLLEFPYWEGFSIVRPHLEMEDVAIGNPDDIYADALGIRPSIRAEELRLKGSERSIRIAQAQYYPSLSLSGGVNTNYYSSFADQNFWQQMSNNFGNFVGLSLSIPIFNRFSTRNQVRTAHLNKQAQEIKLRLVKQTLYKEIQQAWNGAVAARAKWESSQQAESAARDAFELQLAKYENGKATLTEFNESRNRLVKAQSDAVQATYEYLFQTSLVEFYRGGALDF